MAERSVEREDSDGCETTSDETELEAKGNSVGDTQPTPWDALECAVCLQVCIHPVQLPCGHIFCFLCVKGTANQSKRCAMCRQEIPPDFLDHPHLVRKQDLSETTGFEDGQQWFYEGRNGWWQYDERTSCELETAFKRGDKTCELLIAGFLYIIDFENMLQMRRNDPFRRRRIKRDNASIPKKGVAGLRLLTPQDVSSDCDDRELADGEEVGGGTAAGATALVAHITRTLDMSVRSGTDASKRVQSPSRSPVPPNNTPQTPHTPSASSARSSPEVTLDDCLAQAIDDFECLQLNEDQSGGVYVPQLVPVSNDLAYSSEEEV